MTETVATSARFRIRKATLPDEGFAAFFDFVSDDPIIARILPRPLRRFRERGGRLVWDRWAWTSGRDLTEPCTHSTTPCIGRTTSWSRSIEPRHRLAGDGVRNLGSVQDVHQLLRASDVFVLPSWRGGP